MINHARTLLMNIASSAFLADYVADEIIAPAFVPVHVPAELRALRTALFGSDPDRHMLNYRCRQLLCLTHATPLEQYLLSFDNRITYRTTFAALPREQWRPVVTTVSGSGQLTTYGESDASDVTGRIYGGFLVSVDTPGVATIDRIVRPITKVVLNFDVGDRLSLPGSSLEFKLSSASAGQSYRVDEYAEPRRDLSEVVAGASRLGEPVYNYLFGVTQDEPYKTFRALWFRKQELPLRLGALVCALVYRTEELRRA